MSTTALERAELLVNTWLQDTQGLPITLSLSRLGLAIARAITEAEASAFERGLKAGGEVTLEAWKRALSGKES